MSLYISWTFEIIWFWCYPREYLYHKARTNSELHFSNMQNIYVPGIPTMYQNEMKLVGTKKAEWA